MHQMQDLRPPVVSFQISHLITDSLAMTAQNLQLDAANTRSMISNDIQDQNFLIFCFYLITVSPASAYSQGKKKVNINLMHQTQNLQPPEIYTRPDF